MSVVTPYAEPQNTVAPSAAPTTWARRAVRGRVEDPVWVRPALIGLLASTAALYLWGLGASGYANSFYSAAVQAGSTSWKAFFFGSSDASNFITVDKTPASLWVMDISARLFGVNAWSILVPQALEGVAAVGVLYLAVRRRFGPGAGLLAGAVLATTPVAALMFRFNNPDALLTLLLVVAAYAMVRALEDARTMWLVVAGSAIGFGFLTKMLQAFLVVPVFALVYLIAAPTPLGCRIRQVLIGGLAVVVSAGWWVAAVALTPASMRPYVGGSQHNSILELTLGYNGFGRLTGDETGSVGGGPTGAAGRWGATGWDRLFNTEIGGQISWLLPAALIALIAGLWLLRRRPRTDGERASLLLWGGWLVGTALVFSYMQGIFHAYYTVALAPAVAALVGIGAVLLWRQRAGLLPRIVLAGGLGVTALWSAHLLARTPDWHPGLRTLIVVVGTVAAVALLIVDQLSRRAAVVAATAAVAVALAGPTAYAAATAATPHTGAIPTAGPSAVGAFGPGGARPAVGALPGGGRQAGGLPSGGFTPPSGGAGGQGFAPPGMSASPGVPGAGGAQGGAQGGTAGGIGGLLDASTPSSELITLLSQDASSYRWVAAAVGSNSAAGVQLATGDPVIAIGGFNGSDPTPTLEQFEAYVAAGEVHYFIGGGGFGGPGGMASSSSTAIANWVAANFTARTVGGVTLYDLTQPTTGSDTAGTGA